MQRNQIFSYPLTFFTFFFCFIGVAYSSVTDDRTIEPQSGEIEFFSHDNEQGETYQPQYGIQLDNKAHITINGMVAVVEIEQHFENPSEQWREGRYVFPLPDNAAVNSMEIQIGERRITADIKEKQEAKKIYHDAKSEGRKAALFEQHRPNLFSQQIANIDPKEKIIVKLQYIQTIAYKDREFSLRFPMTITPRYQPADNTDKTENTLDTITPPISAKINNTISLSVTLDAGLPLDSIKSDYHSISIVKSATQHSITIADDKTLMDRDFVLRWKTSKDTEPKAALFNQSIDGDDYNLIMLMPPEIKSAKKPMNTETIFIIDTSGSMGGTSIQQAKTSLAYALKRLDKNDTFNIIQFNSTFSTLYPRSQIANKANIYHALSYIGYLRDGGGTEMYPALEAALTQEHDQSRLKQIIFITDGSVTNENALFELIHHKLAASRLFTIGIGSAPNSFFMRKAAEFGKGSFTYIGDLNQVEISMQTLFEKISRPSMHDITVTDTQGRELDIFPNPIPDLYHGEPIFIAIKADYEIDSLLIKGVQQDKNWQQTLTFNHGKNHKGIATIWARKKIESLLDKERTEGKQEALKTAVIQLGIQHRILSPYTSFVAVEEKPSRPEHSPLYKEALPNMLAQGQVLQSVNYPQTATALWLHILLGLSALIASGILRLCK